MDRSFIYSFPFLIYLSKIEKPKTKTFRLKDKLIRVYTPFLGREYGITNAALFNPETIPFNTVSRKRKNLKFLKQKRSINHNDETVEISNCIRIDIINFSKNENQAEFIENLSSTLFSHIRNECNQWGIGSHEYAGDYYVGHFETNEKGDQKSEIVYRIPVHLQKRGLALTENIWEKVINKLAFSEEPDIVKSLVLDAYSFMVSSNYSRMVLSLAWALEIYRDQIIEYIWNKTRSSETFRLGKVLDGNNLTKHLDYQMKQFCGESFKEVKPQEFEEVCNLWNTRNHVAHGKNAFYFREQSRVNLSKENSLKIYDATQSCIKWLFSLKFKE